MIVLHRFLTRTNSWLLACGLMALACGMLTQSGSAQEQLDESQQMADLLGLEPSEYGYLRSNNPLSTNDDFLQLAIAQLGERPFRRLPAQTAVTDFEAKSMRVTGSVECLIRHRFKAQALGDVSLDGAKVPNVGEPTAASFYECLIRVEPSDRDASTGPRTVRVLTAHLPPLWQHLSWQPSTSGEAEWKTGDVGLQLRASAVVINLGQKQWGRNQIASGELDGDSTPDAAKNETTDENSEPRILTGIAKRIEWPETSSTSIVELFQRKKIAGAASVKDTDQTSATSSNQHDQQTANAWIGLGSVGFDLGLWGAVANGQRRPLQPGDNEPFYQLLSASRHSPSAPGIALPIRDLIRDPQSWVGHSFAIHVTIKQVTKVPSDSDDRAAQLGISEYYLLHGVIPLERPLKLKFDGQKQIEYRQHFPVVIATLKLPDGVAVGDESRLWVQGQGRMFKLWSYQSLRSQEAGVDQFAPLLVAGDLRLAGPPVDTSTPWPISGLLLIPVGFGLLFLLVFGLRGLRR
ncbi:MAG: hypothetical protein JNL67_07465 [Planctomycetaceae bacterium]|nr:hypothetical protein [Planctomycetaceae bacterium]